MVGGAVAARPAMGQDGAAVGSPATALARPDRAPTTTAARRGVPAIRHRFSESVTDYAYVAGDLRRIGILAGSLVVLLAALSFILR